MRKVWVLVVLAFAYCRGFCNVVFRSVAQPTEKQPETDVWTPAWQTSASKPEWHAPASESWPREQVWNSVPKGKAWVPSQLSSGPAPTWHAKKGQAAAPTRDAPSAAPEPTFNRARPVSAPMHFFPPMSSRPPKTAPDPAPATAQIKIFMDYIGADAINIKFDAPINKAVDFYYILSFAVDASPNGKYNNGHFVPMWNTHTLTPQAVLRFKRAHPTAKVMMSLCGWSLYNVDSNMDQPLFWYDPKDAALWLDNAFASISSLVHTYHLDGIDIDYENFRYPNNFSSIMGQLITRLRERRVVSFITIAPFHWVIRPYLQLYKAYSSVIDLILYQFYADGLPNARAFLHAYYDRVRAFGGGRLDVPRKLIPGYEIDGRGVQGHEWWEAIGLVQNSTGYELSGMFVWSADNSKRHNYSFEIEAQAFLGNESNQVLGATST